MHHFVKQQSALERHSLVRQITVPRCTHGISSSSQKLIKLDSFVAFVILCFILWIWCSEKWFLQSPIYPLRMNFPVIGFFVISTRLWNPFCNSGLRVFIRSDSIKLGRKLCLLYVGLLFMYSKLVFVRIFSSSSGLPLSIFPLSSSMKSAILRIHWTVSRLSCSYVRNSMLGSARWSYHDITLLK